MVEFGVEKSRLRGLYLLSNLYEEVYGVHNPVIKKISGLLKFCMGVYGLRKPPSQETIQKYEAAKQDLLKMELELLQIMEVYLGISSRITSTMVEKLAGILKTLYRATPMLNQTQAHVLLETLQLQIRSMTKREDFRALLRIVRKKRTSVKRKMD